MRQFWPSAILPIFYGAPTYFAHCYDQAWDDFKQRTYPAPGNHEYHSLSAYGYYNYWGSQAGAERRGYYARRLNGWLVLSLNSEVAADANSPQTRDDNEDARRFSIVIARRWY